MTYCKANTCYNNADYSWEDYCSYHKKCLERLRRSYGESFDNIQKLDTFETWFNKNCGWVVTKVYSSSCPYYVWIVIYEPSYRKISDNISAIRYDNYGSLEYAIDKAKYLKSKLQDSDFHATPMLEVHPEANYYRNFECLITDPYVEKSNLPCREETYYMNGLDYSMGRVQLTHVPTSEPNNYLKPLDIVKSNMGNYYHVGIYLGDNRVCHFSKKGGGLKIHSWEEFTEGNLHGEVVRYHSMIPFKHHRKMVRQIAWAMGRRFQEGNYSLHDRNCEHFANMIVYGINYSEQAENSKTSLTAPTDVARGFFAPFTFGLTLIGGSTTVNNNKGSTIKLTDEMRETNDRLGYITNYKSDEIQARIEIPTKQECKIM